MSPEEIKVGGTYRCCGEGKSVRTVRAITNDPLNGPMVHFYEARWHRASHHFRLGKVELPRFAEWAATEYAPDWRMEPAAAA